MDYELCHMCDSAVLPHEAEETGNWAQGTDGDYYYEILCFRCYEEEG